MAEFHLALYFVTEVVPLSHMIFASLEALSLAAKHETAEIHHIKRLSLFAYKPFIEKVSLLLRNVNFYDSS